jgi:hypothetical protein
MQEKFERIITRYGQNERNEKKTNNYINIRRDIPFEDSSQKC